MFKKTGHNRVFQDLVTQIEKAILSGKLKPGDKLPAQRDLIEKFQTSRASLREALRVLEHKGLIEVKLGVSGGAIVKEISTDTITEDLSILMQHKKVSFDQLAEFRTGVEGCVASLAAQRATSDDIKNLEGLLEEARICLESWETKWDDFFEADLEIHILLARISDNPVYTAVLQMVHENILDMYYFVDQKHLEENYRDLCNIVQAISKGDAELARKATQDHIMQCTASIKAAQENN